MKQAPGDEMRKGKPRGLFERPLGSGVWWINYYVKGKQHREKVGRKNDALRLYGVRKADAALGRKLPELRATKEVTMSDLIDEVLEFVAHHKDRRSYISKGAIVRNKFGSIAASEIKPQDIERWLRSHCKSAATWNRYRAFFSLCYQRGLKHEKVLSNPARQVDHQKESEGRARYLTEDEYNRLHEVIKVGHNRTDQVCRLAQGFVPTGVVVENTLLEPLIFLMNGCGKSRGTHIYATKYGGLHGWIRLAHEAP
jgi:hypothetical protein